MSRRNTFVSWSLLPAVLALLAFCCPAGAGEAQYVIHISVDGAGSSYVQNLLNQNKLPNFKRLMDEGASTFNARCDYNYSETLQNHTTQLTGRGVIGINGNGHGWTGNTDPTTTIHLNKGSYVASVFDVVHDNGLKTGLYTGKSKFSLFDTSYNSTNGGKDEIGADNGRDKLDTYSYASGNSAGLLSGLISSMTAPVPLNYVMYHFADTDTAGHTSISSGGGWGGTLYNNAMMTMDGYLGQIFSMIAGDSDLAGNTAVILTADHGGSGTSHGTASAALNYTIPFFVWGPGVTAGADLYELNPLSRTDPLTGRPDYSGAQPIRNGDAPNLALDLLGLDAIPLSGINALQDLSVPEPATMSLLAMASLALVRRRRS